MLQLVSVYSDIGRITMNQIKKIAILTGGGDCPGLNAVIRAVTKTAILEYGYEVIGLSLIHI